MSFRDKGGNVLGRCTVVVQFVLLHLYPGGDSLMSKGGYACRIVLRVKKVLGSFLYKFVSFRLSLEVKSYTITLTFV